MAAGTHFPQLTKAFLGTRFSDLFLLLSSSIELFLG